MPLNADDALRDDLDDTDAEDLAEPVMGDESFTVPDTDRREQLVKLLEKARKSSSP